MNKKVIRTRRATKTRKKISELRSFRLMVHRSARHMYAQIISQDNSSVLVSASTIEKFIARQLQQVTSNKKAAAMVGEVIAKRAIKKGIIYVSFDRSGFKYHGRIKAVAEHARQFGLKF